LPSSQASLANLCLLLLWGPLHHWCSAGRDSPAMQCTFRCQTCDAQHPVYACNSGCGVCDVHCAAGIVVQYSCCHGPACSPGYLACTPHLAGYSQQQLQDIFEVTLNDEGVTPVSPSQLQEAFPDRLQEVKAEALSSHGICPGISSVDWQELYTVRGGGTVRVRDVENLPDAHFGHLPELLALKHAWQFKVRK
jgi:hypothetical protein